MENGDDNQMHANEGDRALWFEELRRQEELEKQAAGNEAEDNARRQHRWAEQQRYRRLERATHEMCSPRTIKKAIAENREANLIETQRIVDQKNTRRSLMRVTMASFFPLLVRVRAGTISTCWNGITRASAVVPGQSNMETAPNVSTATQLVMNAC